MSSSASSKYIVRQPIKDRNCKVIGYEILYYGENQAFSDIGAGSNSHEFAAADTVYNFLLQNTNKGLKDSLNFMTFTPTLLMKKTPKLFNTSELVIQIDDNVIIHPLAMHLVLQYASAGYKIAINEFQFAPRYLALIDNIDYIKLNFKTLGDNTIHNIVEIAHNKNKKCLAVGIDSKELYEKALSMNVDVFEGSYVAGQMATKAHASGYLQSNFFRLMVAVTRDEPDVNEIVDLISVDATLTYGLLRMVNSRFFALRHKAATVQQAIVILGLSQLKQWIYLLSASNAENQFDEGSEEFLKLSFMRASFCSQLMSYTHNMPISTSDAYLMGMFSTLNYLIDAPLEDILSEVPVLDDIKAALLTQEGRPGLLYKLALSYEHADWPAISDLAAQLNIPTNLLTSVYFNCMEEVNETWRQLTNPGQGDAPEASSEMEETDTPAE